jgi:OFA family oxalate/formate antiporter-like MFS transporter
MGVIAALCLAIPPKGWLPTGWKPPTLSKGTEASRDFTFGETARTPQFWALYAAYFCGAFAGLMVIGHIAGHGRDAGLLPMQAAMAVSMLALMNAITRIVTGIIADKVGSKILLVVYFILQAASMLALYPAGPSVIALAVVASFIGWNYGAMFTLFPATCLQYFGPTAQGSNYGLLFTAWGLAGFAGPYIGGLLKDFTGTYASPFIVAAIMLVIPVIIFILLKPPAKKSA